MKIKVFTLLMVLCFSAFGCSDERLTQPIETVFFGGGGETAEVPSEGTIGPPPPEVQAYLWDQFGTREELIARLADVDKEDPNWADQVDWLLRVICKMDRQRVYYQKYINAGGIAVISDENVYCHRKLGPPPKPRLCYNTI